MLDDALQALHQHFGFGEFREGQDEVIEAILSGENALVVMPTGGGKSLCYQLPALLRDGVTVVISPLIALMKDQVDALQQREIPATFINSSIDFTEQTARLRATRRGEYKLVYIAPERFRSERFVETLGDVRVSLFAVDEAHCISEWGHDFRPDYRRLGAAIQKLNQPQIVALTATATPEVRVDIAQQLGIDEARHFIAGFDRPNLTLRVVHTSTEREKVRHAIETIAGSGGSGIVYAATRKSVESVTNKLRDAGLRVTAYHAGLDDKSRSRAQDEFMAGDVQAIVATNAFGMGIDKPDIRFVVHHHLPGSIEAYYQEIGRAGRDGLPSTCTMLFNFADTRFQQFFIDGSFPSPDLIEDVYRTIASLGHGRHDMSARELASRANIKNEMAVGASLAILERAGHIERSSASEPFASIEFGDAFNQRAVADAERDGSHAQRVLAALVGRTPPRPGAIRQVGLAAIGQDAELTTTQVRRALEQLDSRGVIKYQPTFQERGFVLLDDKPAKALRFDRAELARRAAGEQRKLRRVVDFAYHRGCLRAYILRYFGDRKAALTCGICSGCAPQSKTAPAARAPKAQAEGTLRIPTQNPNADLGTFIREQAPTGDALRERLRTKRDDQTALAEREVHVSPEAIAARPAPLAPLDQENTTIVRKILSCIARTNGRFGKNTIASTLRGSRSKPVIQGGLDRLSTYGLLAEKSQAELVAWCDALIDAGLVSTTTGPYPTIALTPTGRTVMLAQAPAVVDLRRFDLDRPTPPTKPAKARKRSATDEQESNESTVDVTLALFKAGLSVEDISARRSLAPVTIENHLATAIEQGRIVADEFIRLVPKPVFDLIETATSKAGVDRLKPIHDELGGAIRYREIKLAVAAIKRRSGAGISDHKPDFTEDT